MRDLLLGRRPKDFDISTAARPQVVRKLFRNARLIGRRFPIVHLRFGHRIFEVARFRRRDPPDDGGMREVLCHENTYGTPEDDAFARDFTVNALFYDPGLKVVLDYVDGLTDLEAGVLRSIGDPRVWHYEDPVRILRAAKFAGKLGFSLPDSEREAMGERAELLHVCPPSRVVEELFRILEGGSAAGSYRVLWETGVLAELLPELDAAMTASGADGAVFRVLEALDRLVIAHSGLPRDFLFSMLFYPAVVERFFERSPDGRLMPCVDPTADSLGVQVEEWLRERSMKLQIPRAYRARQRALMNIACRLLGPNGARRMGRLARQASFPDVMAMLRLHHRLFGDVAELYEPLRRRADELGLDIVPPLHRPRRRQGRPAGEGRPSRRRQRRSRSRSAARRDDGDRPVD